MKISTSTPGKLILLGEYAVLEGAPAIVAAVNKFAKITLNNSIDKNFYINAPNISINSLSFNLGEDQLLSFNERIK